jgi:diguanylate cyclase (GGDEF)-like protein
MFNPYWLKFIENLIDGAALVNREGKIVWANQSLATLAGLSVRRLQTHNLFTTLNFAEEAARKIGDLRSIMVETPYYRLVSHFEEEERELGISIIPVENEDYLLVLVRDFSFEKQLHDKYQNVLKQKEELYKNHQLKLFQSLFLTTLSETANKVKDPIDVLNRFLPQISEFFGFSAISTFTIKNSELVESGSSLNKSFLRSRFDLLIADITANIKESFLGHQLIHLNIRDCKIVIVPFFANERSLGVTICIRDGIKEITKDEVQMIQIISQQTGICMEAVILREESHTDDLTKAFNIRYFHNILDTMIANVSPFALVMVDVDFFKAVNDTYGHLAGDQVLKSLVNKLKESLRASELVFRYGGEEFAVILPTATKEESMAIAERLRKAISQIPFADINPDLKITASMGISSFPHDSTDKVTLIQLADEALYSAKKSGRNRVVLANQVKRTA